MEIHSPSVPARNRISDDMVEDLLCDPVMAIHVFFRVRLDAFQAARARMIWFTRSVEDHSGFSTGKTFVNWAITQLRAMLIPDHRVLVIFPTFQIGKDQYWSYYASLGTPLFRSQLGRFSEEGDEKSRPGLRDPSSWKMYYRNGSLVNMPAPSVAQESRTLASLRCNTLLMDEWTKAEQANANVAKQLIGRCTRESRNQDHPIWGNKVIRTATAEGAQHPSLRTHRALLKRERRGSPDVWTFGFCYKDYSQLPSATKGKTFRDLFRNDRGIRELRDSLSPEAFLGEGCGVWGSSALGWFSTESIDAALELGRQRDVRVAVSRAEDERQRGAVA